jgi:hypothetical protein
LTSGPPRRVPPKPPPMMANRFQLGNKYVSALRVRSKIRESSFKRKRSTIAAGPVLDFIIRCASL